MTDEQATYPDTREGLTDMLVSCDPGFALYKNRHWAAQVRDVIGPWLDVHDANARTMSAAERARLIDAVTRGVMYRGWMTDLRVILGLPSPDTRAGA